MVHQVKEKFGTPRFCCSPNGGPDSRAAERFDAVVEEAERASASICERCGSPGALIKRGVGSRRCVRPAMAFGLTAIFEGETRPKIRVTAAPTWWDRVKHHARR